MSTSAANRGLATPAQLRAHRAELAHLAADHGLSQLRVAPSGRLVALADEGRSYFDVVRFEQEAAQLIGAPVEVLAETARHPLDTAPEAKGAAAL